MQNSAGRFQHKRIRISGLPSVWVSGEQLAGDQSPQRDDELADRCRQLHPPRED